MQLEDFQVWSGLWLIKCGSIKVKTLLVYLKSDIVAYVADVNKIILSSFAPAWFSLS
jgi:hypothetical protein